MAVSYWLIIQKTQISNCIEYPSPDRATCLSSSQKFGKSLGLGQRVARAGIAPHKKFENFD